MAVSHNRKTMLIAALVASLASPSVFAQDPTDEAAAKINSSFGTALRQKLMDESYLSHLNVWSAARGRSSGRLCRSQET